jgi:hypothetical protein
MNDVTTFDDSMAAARVQETGQEVSSGLHLTLTLESVAYIVLLVAVLLFGLAELDSTPPSTGELPGLLAAFHGQPGASPLTLWAQTLGFSTLGATLLAGRVITLLAGVFVMLSPALFRAELGRTRALLFSLVLCTSAPLLIASRESASVIWTALLAILLVRAGLDALAQDNPRRTGTVIVLAVFLALLSGPLGLLTLIGLLLCGFAAARLGNDTPVTLWDDLRQRWREAPLAASLIIAALAAVALTTQFLTQTRGLDSIGQVLGGFGGLFVPSGQPESALLVGFFYQPFLWVFALIAVYRLTRREWSLTERFLGLSTAFALMSLLLPGARPMQVVLLTLPLAGLASGLLERLFINDLLQGLWREEEADQDELAPLYTVSAGRAILGVVTFVLLLLISVHIQTVAREFLLTLDGAFGGLIARFEGGLTTADVRAGLLWSFIGIMFLLLGYFLAAGVWGTRTTLQGYGLGLLAFMLLVGTSAGWYASITDKGQATEPWSYRATADGYNLLAETLRDFQRREAQGFDILPLTVVRDRELGMTEEGLLGWMLRDTNRTQFVNAAVEARGAPMILLPEGAVADPTAPDLGGSYVGQRFVLTRTWSPNTLTGLDALSWLFQRRTRSATEPEQMLTLWVRQDVYESRPFTDLLPRLSGSE